MRLPRLRVFATESRESMPHSMGRAVRSTPLIRRLDGLAAKLASRSVRTMCPSTSPSAGRVRTAVPSAMTSSGHTAATWLSSGLAAIAAPADAASTVTTAIARRSAAAAWSAVVTAASFAPGAARRRGRWPVSDSASRSA